MKRIILYVSFIFALSSVLALSPIAEAKSKKAPEFSLKSVKQITATIVDIDVAKNLIFVKEGEGEGEGAKKKISTTGAIFLKIMENSNQIVTLADLLKGQKVHIWVNKKSGPKKVLQGLIITQFLGAKALASQPPVAQFSLSSSQGLENSAPSLAISLSKATTNDVKISYTVAGTASGSGTDYTLANGDLIVAAGQTTGIIPLIVANDSAQESDETVVVTLTAVTNASLGTQKIHTYTIKDDDKSGVGFSSSSSNGLESAGSVNFQVSLSPVSLQEARVDYTVSGTASGSGSDFMLANGTAVIAAGQTSTNITATIVDDSNIESSETIIVTLSNPSGATLGSNTVNTYTITDNDQPTIGFSSASSAGAESVTSANIPVALSTVSTKETRVNYALTGTATGSGTDYTLSSGTVTIPAGQTTANIVLTVVNDTIDELDETVILTLSSPVESALSAVTVHTYTIQDNDNPTIQFTSASANGGENVTPVSVGLTLSAAPVAEVQVTYTVTGTATGSGTDYTLANGTATIAAGQLTASISLAIVDDAIADPGETVIITLSAPTNASLGTTTVYTYTINDNE